MILQKPNVTLAILVMFAALFFVSGCAKKSVLKEEAVPKEEAAGREEKPAVSEKTKADEEARRRAEAERAAREAAEKAQAEKEKAAKAPAVQPTKAAFEFVDVHFDFDKFNLKNEDRAILDRDAEWLNNNKNVTITVEGHCDERGTAEYNLALGERRANAVAKYLTDLGVAPQRIKTVSYGFERPLDPGHNESAWAKNRRAHIVVSGQ